jgi:diguanylate cyclase (GGDEF)-like protein
MQRRFAYALTAGLLSSGAPAGLLGRRLRARSDDSVSPRQVKTELTGDGTAYMYVGGAMAIIFALFGYVLGRQVDQLAALSETDSLTGLLNARGFSSRLRSEIKRSKRYREPLTLLFLDLDGLKRINDRDGHRAGSAALREVGSVIHTALRESDVAARWGGDEFTILAPNTSREAGFTLAERMRGEIAGHVSTWPLTASIGVATHEADEDGMPADSGALMRAADTAMYEAKKRGKNTVVIFEQEITRSEENENLLIP